MGIMLPMLATSRGQDLIAYVFSANRLHEVLALDGELPLPHSPGIRLDHGLRLRFRRCRIQFETPIFKYTNGSYLFKVKFQLNGAD